ncbi:rubredoxin [Streptomyces sp. NPDC001978]|uniref:rubredoxin n=1 Tax=Streptomyces sp. NPDC001978 TaxID=3364627 RepID=UPI0036C609C8
MPTTARVWVCQVCGFVYDEAEGWPDEDIPPGTAWEDIPPGTAWEDLPDDWSCPDCGAAKADFEMVEVTHA